MSYIPKYIIKRMFPKETALQLVQYEGEDFVQLQMVNVLQPLTVPDGPYDLGSVNLPDGVADYLKLRVNGIDVPVTPEILLNDVSIWSQGTKHTWHSIMDENSAAGVSIPVGGKLTLLIRKSAFPQELLDLMADGIDAEVALEVKADNPMNFTVPATMHATGEFDPSNT
ncbi:MAG TPA: hypothetical protein VKK79_17475 [Candidatus Lokiarchaeia archaeon]|nr:hypothetical protein [Candidatus Lokiarchaeia archaeon]